MKKILYLLFFALPLAQPAAVHAQREEEMSALQRARMRRDSLRSALLYRFGATRPDYNADSVRAVIVADQGVIIHRDNCAALLKTDSEHQLDADWAMLPDNAGRTYDAAVVVSSLDAHALLAAITSAISDNGADIASVDTLSKSQSGTEGFVAFRFNLNVRDLAHLNAVMAALHQIPQVRKVTRV